MSEKAKRVTFATVIMAALLVVVILLLRSCADDSPRRGTAEPTIPTADSAGDSSGNGLEPDSAVASDRDTVDPKDDSDDARGPVMATRNPPRDTPRPPQPKPGKQPAEDEWDRYLRRTKSIVLDNSGSLRQTVDAITTAIENDDVGAITDGWAPDEGVGPAEAAAYVDSYPELLDIATSNTVTVWTNGEVTVYFAYRIVDWRDGGIVSRHTVAIPLRFIDGVWYLSSYGPDTPGLVFVQSIRI